MSDLLSIASSGLAGYRAALEAVGENVANANTDGFGRRDVRLAARAPGAPPPLFTARGGGLGVDIAEVRRAHDQFLTADARAAAADRALFTIQRQWLAEIETTLGSGEASVGPAITAFYNSAGAVASDPGSIVKRDLFLRSADTAASRFRTASANLDAVGAALSREARFQVTDLNELTRQLALVNDRLRRAPAGTSANAGLRDERDRIINAISEFAPVDVKERARGVVDVRLNDPLGPVLVQGGRAQLLVADDSGAELRVRFARDGADASGALTGGSLSGLIAASRQLDRSRQIIDGLASDFAAAANAAHIEGVGLDGAPGQPLFATETLELAGSRANVGSAAISVAIADGAPLAASGYRLIHNATTGDWLFERQDGTLSVTGPGPLTMDGVTVDITGLAADGDSFTLTRVGGAAGIALRVTEPGAVAASAPFVSGPLLGNVGSGVVSVTPDGSTALPPAAAYRIVFTTPTDFEMQDDLGTVLVPAQPYTAGMTVPGAGFSVTITGAPVMGDRFEIAPASNAHGNGTNMRRLTDTRRAPVGLATFEERWDRETGRVASRLNDTNSALAAAESAEKTAVAARETRAGVDLDTQAADLLRFQQAYQASARVIQTARDTFDTLLAL